MTYWRYSSDIFLDSLNNTMKNLSQQKLISQPKFKTSYLLGLFDLEDEGNVIFRKVSS